MYYNAPTRKTNPLLSAPVVVEDGPIVARCATVPKKDGGSSYRPGIVVAGEIVTPAAARAADRVNAVRDFINPAAKATPAQLATEERIAVALAAAVARAKALRDADRA